MKALLAKIRDMPENLKATIVFAVASFATSGINYITTPIFTRLLTQSEYGVVSVYNSLYAIISVIATLTLSRPGVLNVGLYEHAENRWRYLSSMLGAVAASTVVVSAVVILVWPSASSLIDLPVSLVVLILLTCLLQPSVTFWTSKNRYEYKYKTTFVVTVGSALLAQIVSIAAVFWCSRHVENADLAVVRLWSAGAVNLAVAATLYTYIWIKGKTFIDLPLWKKTFAFALPLIPHYLGFAFLNGTDKIMIQSMVGSDKAGIYSLAAVISTVGSLLWQALCVSLTPYMYAKLGARKFNDVREGVKPLLILVGLCCVLISLAAPEIIRILSTEEYLEGIYVVPPIAAGVFMHILYDVFSNISFFHKKSVLIMLATVTAAAVNVVLNYVCIRQFGYVAAGYTTLASYTLLAILHYGISVKIEKEKVFDVRFSILLSLAVIGACLLCNILYALPVLRYILLAAGILIVILKRKYFIHAVSSLEV
ncbi:MAG: lipopolysaccharide biosynthesis protein [Oscillospiraceae bacterium]